ncbi:MAG TPA: amino acid ABC transporter substrate-binding protein [Candidatus Pullilachnospira intestinigallinarum]|nr:amino acid ABC transporter substrate-binding protein [Candidatus Pullilachnospira intestinigallinarum]
MKKKVISVLLAAAMVSTVFAGCGSGDSRDSSSDASQESSAEESGTDESADAGADAETEETSSAEPDTTYGTNQEGKFVVGFDQEFPPMGFVGDDGEYTGFDLALAAEVASRLDLEFVPQPISWDAKDMELSSGTIDCIWNGFTINGREDDYTFSDPYLDNRQVFVVNSDSDIQSPADLAGKIVEVQADSSAEAALNDNTELSGSFGTLQTVPDYNTAMMDLEQGAVDAIAMDEVVAAYQIQSRESQFRILDEEISSEEYAIGFLKGNEKLRDNVQKVLQEMADDGTMAEISTEWFGSDITTFAK